MTDPNGPPGSLPPPNFNVRVTQIFLAGAVIREVSFIGQWVLVYLGGGY